MRVRLESDEVEILVGGDSVLVYPVELICWACWVKICKTICSIREYIILV